MEMDSIGGGGGNAVALEVRDIMKELVNNERRMLQRELDAAMDRFIDKHHDLLQSTEQTLTTWHLSRINAAKGQQPSMLEIVITNTLVVDNNPGLVEWIQDEPLRQQATECVIKLRNHLNARHGNAFRSDFEKLLTVFMEYLRIKPTSGSGLTNRVNDFKKALHEAIEATDELLSLVHRVKWACYGVRTVCNARSHDSMPLSDAEVQELCACFSALSAAMPTLAREFDTTKPQSPLSVAVPPATAVDLAGFTDMLQSGAATNSDDLQRLILQLMNSANANDAKASGSLTNSSASTPTSVGFNVGAPASLQLQPPPGYPGYPAFRSAPLTAQQPPLPAGPSPGQPPLPSRLPPGLPPAPGTPSTWRDVAQTTPTQTTSIQPLSRRVYQPTEQQIEQVRGFKLFHDNPLEPLPKEKDFLRMAQFARTVIQARNVTKARMCTCYDPSCTNPHTYLEVMEYNPLYKLLVCRQQNHYLTRTVQEDDRCVCLHVDTGIAADFLEKLSDKRKMCVRGARCTSADCVKSHTVEELCWYNPSYKITKCKFQDHLVRNRSGAGPPADCKYYHDTSEMRNPKDDSDYVGKESKILFIERSHKQLADALEALRAVRNQSSW